jgi:hypothetical protein
VIRRPDDLEAEHAIEALEAEADRLREALHRIASWAQAYPLDMFPEPDSDYLKRAAMVLAANGMTLDRISASNMRHVITQVGHIARAALDAVPDPFAEPPP